MKYFFLFTVFFLIVNCNSNKSVYWCGEHACINKSEKEAYYKKTMIVEERDIKNLPYKDKSEINKIIEQAKLNDKTRKNNEKTKLTDERIKKKLQKDSEKVLAKHIRINEKKIAKKEKEIIKQAEFENMQNIKNEKKLNKELISNNLEKNLIENKKNKLPVDKNYLHSNKFDEIVKKIKKNNTMRDYPDINNVPN